MVGTPAQLQERRAIIGLDDEIVGGADPLGQLPVLLVHDLGRGGEHDALPGLGQAVRHLDQMRIEQGRAFSAHHFAEIDGADRRLVGNAEIEIAPALRRPVEQNRAERDLGIGPGRRSGDRHRYLQLLLRKAPSVCR
jgi:hypothetical protein